jgi:tight adherence protein B
MELMIFVLYFLAALLALEGVSALLRKRADPTRVQDRLKNLAADVSGRKEADGHSILRSKSFQLPSLHGVQVMLYRAGGPMTLSRFLIVSVLLSASGFMIAFALSGAVTQMALGASLLFLPYFWVARVAGKRMRLFDEQLPDSLELMTRSIRTGHSLASGFVMVGEEMQDPIATEFGLVAEELRLGLELREALENLNRRIGNEDLPYFSTAVLIQRQTGGNLAELLDKLSSMLRDRNQFAGRVKAMTAQGRGAATFLVLWLPFMVLAMFLTAPAYLAPLLETPTGNMILAGAFVIDGIAYVMARRIADVQA